MRKLLLLTVAAAVLTIGIGAPALAQAPGTATYYPTPVNGYTYAPVYANGYAGFYTYRYVPTYARFYTTNVAPAPVYYYTVAPVHSNGAWTAWAQYERMHGYQR